MIPAYVPSINAVCPLLCAAASAACTDATSPVSRAPSCTAWLNATSAA